MEKKKNIVLVLLFIIIAVMACFGVKMSKEIFELKKGTNQNINTNQNDNNNNVIDNNQNTNNDQNNVVSNAEINVDNPSIKSILITNVNQLLWDKNNNSNLMSTMSHYFNYNLLRNKKLSDSDKLKTILKTLDKGNFKPINISLDKVGNSTLKNKHSDWITSAYFDMESQVEISVIEKEFSKLFDGTIKYQDYDMEENCPGFYYDELNKVYYRISECGGTEPSSINTYVNKISYNNNNYYVYLNVGYFEIGDKLYIDIDKSKVAEGVNIPQEFSTSLINETNYMQFSEYKFTFEKNSEGNYIYKSIERIK